MDQPLTNRHSRHYSNVPFPSLNSIPSNIFLTVSVLEQLHTLPAQAFQQLKSSTLVVGVPPPLHVTSVSLPSLSRSLCGGWFKVNFEFPSPYGRFPPHIIYIIMICPISLCLIFHNIIDFIKPVFSLPANSVNTLLT